jgi:DNA replication protein DnaC
MAPNKVKGAIFWYQNTIVSFLNATRLRIILLIRDFEEWGPIMR